MKSQGNVKLDTNPPIPPIQIHSSPPSTFYRLLLSCIQILALSYSVLLISVKLVLLPALPDLCSRTRTLQLGKRCPLSFNSSAVCVMQRAQNMPMCCDLQGQGVYTKTQLIYKTYAT